MTQPPIMAAMIHPRSMFTYRGKRTVRSFAALMEFAVIFVPTCAIYQANAAKKAAARPPWPRSNHLARISRGSQIGFP